MKRISDMTREEMLEMRRTLNQHRAAFETAVNTYDNPVDSFEYLVGFFGYDEALQVVAEIVKTVGDWDARIWPSSRDWADGIETYAADDLKDRGHYTNVHPVHVNQIAQAAMTSTRPADEADETDEAAEIVEKPELKHNADGVGYVDYNDVASDRLNISAGNDKLGKLANISFPIHYTCDHRAECYRRKQCYALNGCYCFTSNQKKYAENLAYFRRHTAAEIVAEIVEKVDAMKTPDFRWFGAGDVAGPKTLAIMRQAAEKRPAVRWYGYTKKHAMLSGFLAKHGAMPDNLNIMPSLWTSDSGKIQKIPNPHGLAVTVFIPYGHEDLLTDSMFLCPCGRPGWTGKCTGCQGCPTGRHKIIAFYEHSTGRTKGRDKALRTARNEAKKA